MHKRGISRNEENLQKSFANFYFYFSAPARSIFLLQKMENNFFLLWVNHMLDTKYIFFDLYITWGKYNIPILQIEKIGFSKSNYSYPQKTENRILFLYSSSIERYILIDILVQILIFYCHVCRVLGCFLFLYPIYTTLNDIQYSPKTT